MTSTTLAPPAPKEVVEKERERDPNVCHLGKIEMGAPFCGGKGMTMDAQVPGHTRNGKCTSCGHTRCPDCLALVGMLG